MQRGTVVWFKSATGFGFIAPIEGGEDLFVHYSQIQMDGYKKLDKGDLVEFKIGVGPKNKPQAEEVRVIQKAVA